MSFNSYPLVQDLQLVIELFIEHIFEVVRNVVHHVLSPFKTFREFLHWAFFRDTSYHDYVDTADMIVLGDSHPDPHKQKQVLQQPLNTDNRTCQDIITSFGLVPTFWISLSANSSTELFQPLSDIQYTLIVMAFSSRYMLHKDCIIF